METLETGVGYLSYFLGMLTKLYLDDTQAGSIEVDEDDSVEFLLGGLAHEEHG